jgi:hypothetical protein
MIDDVNALITNWFYLQPQVPVAVLMKMIVPNRNSTGFSFEVSLIL